ncbi:MAG: hypothetical protein AAB560_03415 [Patescibacteria group bacterium]
MEDKFLFNKKWFWVGIVIAVINFSAGLIYGIALIIEPSHRKEGGVIIACSAIAAVVMMAFLYPYLRSL